MFKEVGQSKCCKEYQVSLAIEVMADQAWIYLMRPADEIVKFYPEGIV